MSDEDNEHAVRLVDESTKPAGRRDDSAPLVGPQSVPTDNDAFLMSLFDGLPENDKGGFAAELAKSRSEQIAAGLKASRQARREWMRMGLTTLLFLGIIAYGAVALYIGVMAKSASWDTVKDWLAYSLAPLVAAATVAAAFWFPSRETD